MKCKYCDNEAKGISPSGGDFLCEKHSMSIPRIIETLKPKPPTPLEPPKPDSEGGHHPGPGPGQGPLGDSEGVE